MAFIVKKKVHGNDYYYLNKSVREGDKVKSITIAYLGKTREEAELKAKEILNKKEDDKIVKSLTIDDIAIFCKRKGFVFPSGEIYGGFSGFWDFGPLGVELKKNIKESWWKFFVQSREDITGIDGSIITHPKTWEASGHIESFSDVYVTCKKCCKINKVDKHVLNNSACEFCKGELNKENAKDLNLMFKTQVGPVKEDSIVSYLRPETAQLIFSDFKQVSELSRIKLPFGIAQIGKAFRNEIAPRDFLFRSREFEQMEIEYFIIPNDLCPYEIPDIKVLIYSADSQKEKKDAEEMRIKDALGKKIIKRDWHAYWLSTCLSWFKSLGCNIKNFRIRQHQKDELAHYSSDCWDLEYKFPFGWKELTGIADRSTYDLSRHEEFSGKDLKLFVDGRGKILPEVVAEPSFGVERAFLVFMLEAYEEDKKRENIVLHLHNKLSPFKVGVFPLVNKLDDEARKIYYDLRLEFHTFYDKSGSIGRRYARQDEIGTPYCVTIDFDSLKDNDATIRHRDSTRQIRVKTRELKEVLRKLLSEEIKFEQAGKLIK